MTPFPHQKKKKTILLNYSFIFLVFLTIFFKKQSICDQEMWLTLNKHHKCRSSPHWPQSWTTISILTPYLPETYFNIIIPSLSGHTSGCFPRCFPSVIWKFLQQENEYNIFKKDDTLHSQFMFSSYQYSDLLSWREIVTTVIHEKEMSDLPVLQGWWCLNFDWEKCLLAKNSISQISKQ